MSSWSETFFGVGGGGLSTAALRLPNWCRSGAMSPPPGRILFRAANARRGYAHQKMCSGVLWPFYSAQRLQALAKVSL